MPEPETSESSDEDLSDICDDDELDDIELSFIPTIQEPTESNEICCICGEIGKDKELWYRCVLCSSWNHAECTGMDTPKNYMCDFCKN